MRGTADERRTFQSRQSLSRRVSLTGERAFSSFFRPLDTSIMFMVSPGREDKRRLTRSASRKRPQVPAHLKKRKEEVLATLSELKENVTPIVDFLSRLAPLRSWLAVST